MLFTKRVLPSGSTEGAYNMPLSLSGGGYVAFEMLWKEDTCELGVLLNNNITLSNKARLMILH